MDGLIPARFLAEGILLALFLVGRPACSVLADGYLLALFSVGR